MTIHAGGRARIVYLGTPEIAVAPLQALVAAGHDVALVVTNPDRRRGRGQDLMPTPVKAAAQELGIAVSHDIDDAIAVEADLGVVVAFGHLLKPHILDALPLVNLHFSLLPRWRGAAPLERAILAGDEFTGVCLMRIVEELDAGGVYARRSVEVGDATLDELRHALVEASCALLVEELEAGLGPIEPQVGEPTYARKLSTEDHRLDFDRSARELSRVVRLGRAWTLVDGKRLRVLAATPDPTPVGSVESGTIEHTRVATADGWLMLERVQPEGKKPVAADDWRRGARLADGSVLGA